MLASAMPTKGTDGPARTQRVDSRALEAWIDGGVAEIVRGPGVGESVRVEGSRVVVGRDPGCDLTIDDPRVSAAHLELVPTERGVVGRDLQTTNGTRIGDLSILEVVLHDGVEMSVGDSVVRFRYDESPRRVERSTESRFHSLVGESAPMRTLFAELRRVAGTKLNVLVEGETGTGKEEVARSLHAESARARGPFVVVDCGAIAPNLLESTLFGHEKGAFSGAQSRHVGLIETAAGGTLFLDEVGELPLEAQTRLLRVLEARTIRRVGGTKEVEVDIRVVAATHRDLPAMVSAGTFRADLFFRLATARIRVPALRERLGDVPLLCRELLERIADDEVPRMSDEALEALGRRDFPGNVRELRNTLDVAAAFCRDGVVLPGDLSSEPPALPAMAAAPRAPRATESVDGADVSTDVLYREGKELAIEAFDRAYLGRLLEEQDGNITRAAARAGLERHHLRSLLKKRGLWKPK